PRGVDWEAIGAVGGTVVVLMATATIGRIALRLMAGGLPPHTPAAAITNGTLPDQVLWRGTVADLEDGRIPAPAAVVIGAVAALGADEAALRATTSGAAGAMGPADAAGPAEEPG